MFGISLARISLLTGSSLGGGVGVSATLDLNFRGQGYSAAMAGYTFNQLIDFTRTSAATYVDASGRIVPTAASRNLLVFTQEFDNGVWTKGEVTVAANSATAPDGTLTADKLVATTAAAYHGVSRVFTLTNATAYTYSFYAKASEYSLVRLAEAGNGAFYASFNLSTQSVVSGDTGGGQFVSASISNVGNGWFRCSVAFINTSGSVYFALAGYPAGATVTPYGVTYTGDGTSGVFLWGAQLEANTTATDYTRNVGGVFPPRFDYDPVTLAPRGLLVEEQRTNLLRYSEQFDNVYWAPARLTVTANATTSPDGTADADKLVEDTNNNTHVVYVYPGTPAGTSTLSVYAKPAGRDWICLETDAAGTRSFFNVATGTLGTVGLTVTATITAAGNGWYRCTITGSLSGGVYIGPANANGSATYTGDGTSGVFVWGAQLEAGDFATSYIPTVASQVTRTADVATITGANFSQWYNTAEGTIFVDAMGSPAVPATVWAPNTTGAPAITDNDGGGNNIRASLRGVAYVDTGGVATTAGQQFKIAFAYKQADYASSVNGGAVQASANAAAPAAVTSSTIGSSASATFLNGHIRSIKYFPTRLSNAQLQALTA